MKNTEKFEKAFKYFKQPYVYAMGGTQTVVLPNGKEKYFDDREYYSGRGKKYNSSIRHDEKGIVKVTRKEYSDFLKMLREKEERAKIRKQKAEEKQARIEAAKQAGVYDLVKYDYGTFVELSDDEIYSKHFDAERLAKTLDISVEDANLLKSEGKTYVFAKQKKTGKTIELFHPSLFCNPLSISIEEVTEERLKQFDHEEWASAPYAEEVGQTEAKNHFVC